MSSKGSVYDLSLIDLQEDGKPLENGWRETVEQSFKGDYSNILPSMNFKLSITDDLIYRFSAAQVISRPSLGYLRPWLAPNFDTYREGLPQLSMGDSSLTPEEANQADMTLEWYFEDSSSLSGGVFVKDLKSFIDYVESPVEIEGVRYFASYPGKSKYGATIKGAEFAYQQSLENLLPEPFNGLGFQLNSLKKLEITTLERLLGTISILEFSSLGQMKLVLNGKNCIPPLFRRNFSGSNQRMKSGKQSHNTTK